MKKSIITAILSFAFLLGGLASANAATLTVTKIADSNDNVCDADCSLREAIFAAAASGDVIEFASPLFDTAQTITLTSGALFQDKTLTINGRGANLTRVSGNNLTRVFLTGNNGNSTLNNLTITGGRDTGVGGSGIYNDGIMTINNCVISGNNGTTRGGGIVNPAGKTLIINDTLITNNSVSNPNIVEGGGIYNAGHTEVRRSTVSGNVASTSNSISFGGGIYNSATLIVESSTLSGNTTSSSTFNYGGAIYTFSGTVILTNTTVSENTTLGSNTSGGILFDSGNLLITNSTVTRNSGGIDKGSGTVRAINSIISGNSGVNLTGSLNVNTANLIGGDAQLAPLGNNGGATQTHLPLSGSPVINAGNNCVLMANGCGGVENPALITDQRGAGFSRFLGTAVDIGAVEDSRGFVINAASSGAGSLRQVIEDAPAGGTIRFDPAFFNQPRTISARINIFKNLTIIGPGSGLLTIDAGGSGRVLNIDGSSTVTISGIRFTGGNSGANANAGGILINGGSRLDATDIIVENCAAGVHGGGLYSTGTLNLTNSTVRSNTAGQLGGGIFNTGTLTAINSTISENAAAFGGGIYNDCGRTATVNNSIIGNNTSTGGAGGIGNCGTLNVFGSTFSGNSATFGGALTAGTISIINNSTISGNTATTDKAGAVYIGTTDRLDTTNTTITNNVSNGNLTGGIYSDGGLYQTRNSIIAGNRNGNGGGAQDVSGVITGFGYNLLGTTTGNSYANITTGNLVGAANLAPLGNYGGATQTHALLPNSPAINAGDPNNIFTTDQRGSLRPIGASVDIGAFERNIVFDQTTLPNGTQSAAYSQTLTITRLTSLADNLLTSENLAPFTFAIIPIAGQGLPSGLNLSSDGQISGTPTNTGSFTFTVKAADADGISGVQQYTMQILAPTSANVSISGRVSTLSGNGLTNVIVVLTNANGETRTVRTTSFGYFKFDEVEAGQMVVVSVISKRFQFTPQVITVNEEITGLNLTANE